MIPLTLWPSRFRHGVIFSLMSLLLSALFILLFWSANSARIDTTSSAAAVKVVVMNNFLSAADSFVVDAARTDTRAVLAGVTKNLENSDSNFPVSYIKDWIDSCLRTGLYGGTSDYCFVDGNDSSLNASLAALSAMAADEMNLSVKYSFVSDVSVDDWLPFELKVSFTLRTIVADPLFAQWNRTKLYTVFVDVDGLPDPLFVRYGDTLMTPGNTRRNITRFNLTIDEMNLTELNRLIVWEEYLPNPRLAPSYLQQLAGNLTGTSPAGYETLLLPSATVLGDTDSPLRGNVSYTAHQYFYEDSTGHYLPCGNTTGTTQWTVGVKDFTPGFRLDLPRMARYNINITEMNFGGCTS